MRLNSTNVLILAWIPIGVFLLLVSPVCSQPTNPVPALPTSVIGPDRKLVTTPLVPYVTGAAIEGVVANARVFRNTTTNQVSFVKGLVTVPGAVTPEQVAIGFLSANHAVFGLTPTASELTLDKQLLTGTGTVLTYVQSFGGLPVLYGSVSVWVKGDLSVSRADFNNILINQPPPAQNYNPTNSAQAIAVAIKALKGSSVNNPQAIAEAVVHVKNGTPTVAWLVQFRNSLLAPWEVLVDANTLQPIEVHSMVTVD